jgi:hypothetical protein
MALVEQHVVAGAGQSAVGNGGGSAVLVGQEVMAV